MKYSSQLKWKRLVKYNDSLHIITHELYPLIKTLKQEIKKLIVLLFTSIEKILNALKIVMY